MTLFAGSILPYGGSSAPSGFLLCDGSAVSRSTYSALFAAIGTAYGSGDGSTTFNVPDLRGRVPAGKDDMGGTAASRLTNATMSPDGITLGATGGEEEHTLTVAEIPAHTHGTVTWNGSDGDTNHTRLSCYNIDGGSAAGPDTDSTGGDGSHNNVQPTIIASYIIATEDSGGNSVSLANVKTIVSCRG